MRFGHSRIFASTLLAVGLLSPVARARYGGQAYLHDHRATVLSAAGKPLAGVSVIAAIFDPNGIGYFWDAVLSDSAGVARIGDCEVVVAVAADGSIAVSKNVKEVRFGPTGTVKLKLTSPSGKGLGNRMVDLAPEKEAEVLSTVGGLIPTNFVSMPTGVLAPLLMHRTDRNGDVEFRGIPVGVPFEVITPISDGSSLRFGSVKAGSIQRVIVTHDCEITGHLRNAKGRPVKGVNVELGVTSYVVGDLDSEMPVFFRCRTDANGFYRITHAPNCQLQVQVRTRSDDRPEVKFVNGKKVEYAGWAYLEVKPGRNRFELRI